MAPRASWKGHLRLSLVSCAVKLFPATSASERISFNQLHKDTHNRINMKPVDPELGLVERSDLVRGAHRQCEAVCGRLAEQEEVAAWPGKKVPRP